MIADCRSLHDRSHDPLSNASFLVRYAANLNIGESYIDITNTGANGASLLGPGDGFAAGNICVNVYAFDPGEELIACCSCLVTPDQTVTLGVNRDLTVKPLTGAVPTSVTVKLLSTLAGGDGTGTSCTNSAGAVTSATLANGMAAWGTTLYLDASGAADYATPQTASMGATLSANELASIGGRCAAFWATAAASAFAPCRAAPSARRSSSSSRGLSRAGVNCCSERGRCCVAGRELVPERN